MDTGSVDAALALRGPSLAGVARWLSVALALMALAVFAWGRGSDPAWGGLQAVGLTLCSIGAGLVASRLRALEEGYRRLLERIQDGVLVVRDGRIAYANDVLAQLTRRTVDELRGTPFLDLVPVEERPLLMERYADWEGRQRLAGLVETRIRRADGELRLVSVRAGAVDAAGRVFIATVRDVTAERAIEAENARLFDEAKASLARVVEANQRLSELDRMRQQYLRNVSHEFRSPLTVIRGYADWLQEGAQPQAVPAVARLMAESCDRLIDLVDTLIDMSRIEQNAGGGGGALQVRPVDLREVAAGPVQALRPAAERKGVGLELQMAGEDLSLEADPGLLAQVVRKLVDNAVKYSDSGTRVVVRARCEGDQMCLQVEDAGVGIPPEHLPRIFEKFYMVDGSLTRRVGGTGVGLYLVREIVRLHHGTVTVESLPGRGSVFSVRLPRSFQGPQPRALA